MAPPAAVLAVLVRAQGITETATKVRGLNDDLEKAGTRGAKHLGALKIAAGALGGIVAFETLKKGIGAAVDEFQEARKVGAQTSAVLKSTGGVAHVSAKQITDLAGSISKKVGIDDEAIQSGENLLLTFKNVRNETGRGRDIFNQATQAAVDLSAAGFGSLHSTSIQLGKALNDSVKGMTALARAGVTFSDDQKKAIKALLDTGKAADRVKAQQIILREVQSQVGGSAAAQATTLDKLKVTLSNVAEAAGAVLVPAMDKGAKILNEFFGQIMENRGVGGALVSTFKDLGAVIGTVVSIVSGAVGWFKEHETVTRALAAAVVVFAAAYAVSLIPALIATTAAVYAQVAGWIALKIAFLASPIGLIVVGIAALAAGLVIAYQKSETFRDIVNAVWDAIKTAIGWVVNLTGSIIRLAGELVSAGRAAITGFVNGIKAMAGFLVGAGHWIIDRIAEGVKTITTAVADIGRWILTSYVGLIKAEVGGLTAVGSWILGVIATGFRAVLGPLGEAAAWLRHNIGEQVKQEVGAIAGIGGWIVGAIVGGIKASLDAVKDAAKWLKDKLVDAVKDFFKIGSPSKVMEDLGASMIGGLVKGFTSVDIKGMIGTTFGGMESLAGNLVGGKSLGGVGLGGVYGKDDLSRWLTTALLITRHFSADNLKALYGRAMQESTGNPHAINLWDINAQQGHPSKGLLQTIDSTFNAYKMAGHGDIWNPVDNAIAAIRYMFARYGHIVGPSGAGYEKGTLGAQRGWAWVGERGPELVRFRGGERVYPHEQSVGGVTVNIANADMRSITSAHVFANKLAFRLA